ncbi:aminotransferase class I/II-fold pyridoxal phosphate-dependent enzyme, partial [Rhizobium ruizarguesonis]
VVAKPEWIDGLTDLKIATTFGGGRLTAELVLNVLSDGSYRKHMETLRHRLSRATSEVSAKLKNLGITPWLEPQAGMFLWCRLPDGIDAADAARAALEKRIVLAPGNAFSLSQSATNFMRFNVSQTLDPRVFEVLGDALAGRG